MPITKSAKKAIRQNEKRKKMNDIKRKKMRGLIKEIKALLDEKKVDEAEKLLPKTYQAIDKAAKTNVIKKNTASRKKSRIIKAITREKTNLNSDNKEA